VDRELFDRDFLKKLESLSLLSRRLYRGEAKGGHASPRRGTSVDFADYRTYQAGDDFRTIDWNVFGRLDRLFVKLFAEEEDLSVHILLDASRSMAFGTPRKIDYARRLAAALGYIGLASLDRVGAVSFASRPGAALAPRRGRTQVFHLFEHLGRIAPVGRTDISRALEEYARRAASPGLAVVISDLLDGSAPAAYRRGLLALRFRGFDVVLVQVLDRDEIAPGDEGLVRFADMETGRTLNVAVDAKLRAAYHRKAAGFFAGVEEFCLDNRIEYLRTSTVVPFEDVVLKYLRQGAHLHSR
jgi:uncharacterized protein (DUF58 family)